VGTADGRNSVGAAVGNKVGTAEGFSVGVPMGFLVGAAVVGAAVGTGKHSQAPLLEIYPDLQATHPPVAPVIGMY